MPASDDAPPLTARDSDHAALLPRFGAADHDERERAWQFQSTERELLAMLDAENADDGSSKRKLVGLFDRFRLEYTQLSIALRESLHAQRKLLEKVLV